MSWEFVLKNTNFGWERRATWRDIWYVIYDQDGRVIETKLPTDHARVPEWPGDDDPRVLVVNLIGTRWNKF